MKPKRKIISLLLAICLVAGLLPQAAFAAGTDTGKAIQLVDSGTAANISGGQADSVYFGTYKQSSAGNGGYNTDPIKWRVLENADKELFLLSDQNLDAFEYHKEGESVTWETSTMRSWLNGLAANQGSGDSAIDYADNNFLDNAFSAKEQTAIADTKVVNEDNPNYDTEGGNNTTDKMFLLSIAEANNSIYFPNGNNSRKSTNTAYVADGGEIGTNEMVGVSEVDSWWLRSPGNPGDHAACVGRTGGILMSSYSVISRYVSVRPAFNLDLNSVLFTSAAVGGKPEGGLQAVEDYTGSEWKLTLLDASRKFAVTEDAASGKPGDTVTLNYTGATTGTNEYISAIIEDDNGVQYYGRIAQPNTADGQIEIKIPASLAAGTYTLHVFSEQYNGDKWTDYASAFDTVALTIEDTSTPPLAENQAIQLGTGGISGYDSAAGYDYIYFGNWIAPDENTTSGPIKWRVLDDQTNTGGNGLFLLSDGLFGTGDWGGVYFDNSGNNSNAWQNSTARTWCGTFYNDNFSEGEQGAVLATTKNDGAFTSSTNSVPFAASENILNGDKVFFLSAEEAENSTYGFTDDNARAANYGNSAKVWWLRSPYAIYTRNAGVVYDYGYVEFSAVHLVLAARPAFNLELSSVLFTSAAKGGKPENGLQAVEDYTGSEWKLTLLDESRQFVISNAVIDSGGTIAFSYSGAQTGVNEYISAVVEDNGAITHYGRILQLDGAANGESGMASLTLPAGVTLSDTTKLYVFNEQYNGGANDDTKLTDYASNLIAVNVDTTTPTLTAGSASRESDTVATVKFTSGEAGNYYYAVVESGAAEPEVDTSGTGTPCDTTEQTISLTSLTAGEKDIYIVVKDAAGNVSGKLKMTIPAYVAPSYGISANPSALSFESKTVGYEAAPAAQIVTIQNTGNQTITLNQPTATDFNIGTLSTTDLAAGGTATFTVQPKTGLAAGSHNETLTISGSGNASVQVALSFNVTETAPVTYTLTVELKGGSGSTTGGKYAEGSVIHIDAGSRSNYRFDEWTSSNGGTFANPSSASTTFTMPAADTTITANWEQESTPSTEYTVTFDAQGGSVAPATMQTVGGKLPSLPVPSRSSYIFEGWFTQGRGGAKITTDSTFTADTTIYAHWKYSGGGSSGGEDTTTYYTLTFNTNGGSKIDTFRTSSYGKIVDLSDYAPTREGYDFSGWYSDKGLTNKITEIKLTGNKTVYAGWEEKKENPGTGFENPFTDVSEKDWFYDDVMFVLANDLMVGTSSTTFDPYGTTTRAMVATTIWRMEGEPKPEGKNHFTDVENGKWYTEAITWAHENGITAGYDNRLFGTNDPVTREQLAAFFYRYAEYKGYDTEITGSLDRFADKDDISEWAQEAMAWAVGYGIFEGRDDNKIAPQDNATRAEFAAMLHRFCERNELEKGITAAGGMGWINPNMPTDNPKTGDSSSITFWTSMLLCSLVAACITLSAILKRQRKSGEDAAQLIHP